ncbi:fasciclin domain-containing protein [Sphaerisporangium aureirubrum]|uniref:Fasciclin domain-containing protein n=1 Tax=Sphaerisporangium aureirubrum TaxID=1544736 RepID=A0ABW1NAZ9_9ACTN
MKSRLLALPLAAATLSISATYAAATTGGGTGTAYVPATAGVRVQPTEPPEDSPTATPTESTSASPGMAPVGPGCGSLPKSGPGSPADLAGQPVGTALSQIPELSTLSRAVEKADLKDTLDSAEDITVFAPVDKSFEKIPKETLDKVMDDKETLQELLKYHIVKKRLAPADLANGNFTSVQGGKITTSGSGQDFKVNDAKVLCGNIQTKNATVYLIDAVLKPRG